MKDWRLRKLMPSVSSGPVRKLGNKVRRFFLCLAGRDYIADQEKLRTGDCVFCGACCKLLFKCPFLVESGEMFLCGIYHLGRPGQCAAFPIDERDLADVNFKCGYSFAQKQESPEVQSLSTPS